MKESNAKKTMNVVALQLKQDYISQIKNIKNNFSRMTETERINLTVTSIVYILGSLKGMGIAIFDPVKFVTDQVSKNELVGDIPAIYLQAIYELMEFDLNKCEFVFPVGWNQFQLKSNVNKKLEEIVENDRYKNPVITYRE